MKLSRTKLINDLNKVLPGIASGATIMEGADTVIFNNGYIYSYNSAISVIAKESEERGLNGIVKAQDFYKCITGLPSDEIEVVAEEESWKISDSNISVTMNLLPKNEIYKRFQEVKLGDNWSSIDGEDFNKALKTCNIQGNNTAFAGAFVDDNIMISTNQWIINKFTLKDTYPKMWISAACMAELLKWNNFNGVQYDKQWIHFRSADDTVFSIRTMDVNQFPLAKISGVIEADKSKKAYAQIELSKKFYEAIKRASAFSNEIDEHEVIKVSFGPEVTINGSRVSGSYKEVVDDMSIKDKMFILNFDISEILSSEGVMSNLDVVSETGEVDFSKPVRVILHNDSCIKIFSSVN